MEKENLRTFVSFFTEFGVVLTHPTFLEAAEFPRSDGFLFFYAKPGEGWRRSVGPIM